MGQKALTSGTPLRKNAAVTQAKRPEFERANPVRRSPFGPRWMTELAPVGGEIIQHNRACRTASVERPNYLETIVAPNQDAA
jgi:hypothetical protein